MVLLSGVRRGVTFGEVFAGCAKVTKELPSLRRCLRDLLGGVEISISLLCLVGEPASAMSSSLVSDALFAVRVDEFI